MGDGDRNISTSEIDRQLLSDLSGEEEVSDYASSDFSDSDLFDDDTDEDPNYEPGEEGRPRLVGRSFSRNDPLMEYSSSDEEEPTSAPRDRPSTSRPIPSTQPSSWPSRQVLSDSSDDEEEGNGIWQTINEGDFSYIDNFSFDETPGPRHCPPSTAEPIDFFNIFFTQSLINMFVLETNRYATQTLASRGRNLSPNSRLHSWVAVTNSEIRAFIAVILNMGLIKKPTIFSYWTINKSQATPWFRQMFTRNRFQIILNFFHLVDNTKLPNSTQPNYDPAQKFQPLIDHCNRLFQRFYVGHQQLSIDESLIGTKGQTALMQYLPNKHHHRWGIKLWVLCDSVSNYCMSMLCYKGKKSSENREEIKKFGLGFTVVKTLLSACNCLKKGYHLFTDNFFTSIPLIQFLYKNKTFQTGTIRKNKKHLPNEMKQKLNVGQKIYLKLNEILGLAYRQKKSQTKPVLLVSTKSDSVDRELTKRRHGRLTTEKKPSMVLDYNKYMGGIDTFDMMLYSYLDERKTMKYWKKAAFNIFSRMVLNAYTIYKETRINSNEKAMSRYKFVVSIIDSITEEWLQESNQRPGASGDHPRRARGLEKLPEKKEKTCWVCSKGGEAYKKNAGRKRSRTVCTQCGEGCHGACFPKHKCRR